MKLIGLVFENKEFSNYIKSVTILTEHTKEELQDEVDIILKQKPLLRENIRKGLYVEVVKDILDILIYKGIIKYPTKTPTGTYQILI